MRTVGGSRSGGVILGLLSLCYPWLILGVYGNSRLILGLWLVIISLWIVRVRSISATGKVIAMLLVVAVTALALSGQFSTQLLAKMHPVLVSLGLFAVFSLSIFKPPSVIERVIRSTGRPVSAAAAVYMRAVTWVWAVFFLVNAGIAAWLGASDDVIAWAFYNGFLSYVIIASLMAIEFVVRKWYQRAVASGQSSEKEHTTA